MAIVEETIGAGKDRATPALWELNVGVFGTDTYKGIIQENAEFAAVTLTGSTGTPSITSYLWLTTDPANRHAGVAGTGHARMRNTASLTHCIVMDSAFCRVEGLEIEQASSGTSDEGIRTNGDLTGLLVQSCIIHAGGTTNDQDAIFIATDTGTSSISIDNCIIYQWARGGIQCQNVTGTLTVNSDHNTIWSCGETGENRSGAIRIDSTDTGSTCIVNVFNTWGADAVEHAPFNDGRSGDSQPSEPDGSVTWNGSDNGRDDTATHIQGTDNTTVWEDATDGVVAVTKSTGSWIVVVNITGGSENLLLLDDAAGNLMAGNGIDRQGSEPDARQDFSVDITGSARPTTQVDIGAHQITVVGGPAAFPTPHRRPVYHPRRKRKQVFA